MKKNKTNQTPLPATFASLEEMVEFWDKHDTADYPEAWREVSFQVTTRKRRYPRITLEPKLRLQLERRARASHESLNSLVNRMLKESLTHTTQ